MPRNRPAERLFETATVFWLGAIVPPLGAGLSLAALVDRWRRRLLPSPARLPAALVALLPCAWLVLWAWQKATALRFDEASGLYQPMLDPARLDPIRRFFLLAFLLHYFAGALVGALWGARTAPLGAATVRAGLGAIAGAGWAWCLAGAYFILGGAGRTRFDLGLLFVLVPVASLAVARWLEREAEEKLDWTRVAD